MDTQPARRRRNPEQVVGAAALVGLVAGLIITAVVSLATVFIRALNEGGSVRQAFGAVVITDAEDWELIPMFLLGAAAVGAICSVVAVAVWWEVNTRMPTRPWLAQAAAAVVVAAPVLVLLLSMVSVWPFAIAVAIVAALVAAVTTPLVAFERPRRSPAPAIHL